MNEISNRKKERIAPKWNLILITISGVIFCCASTSAAASVSQDQSTTTEVSKTRAPLNFAEETTPSVEGSDDPQNELFDWKKWQIESDSTMVGSDVSNIVNSIIEQFVLILSRLNDLWKSSENSSILNENICRTKGCHDSASTYLKNMDLSVDPCDNFYRFACGGFLNSTIIPGDKDKVNAFTMIKDELEDQLRSSIEAPVEENDPKSIRLVKNFYKSCMDHDEIEAQSLNSLRKILKKIGGWPVIDGNYSNIDNFDWKNAIYQILDAGYDMQYLITMYVFPDLKTNTKQSIYIDQQSFGLSYKHLIKGFDDKIVQAYYSYMIDIAVILGAERERATIELKEALLFELELSKISKSVKERQNTNSYYNPITVAELKKTYSNIPWMKYFNKLLPSNDPIKEDEKLILGNPRYFENLEELMSKTEKKIQANYLMWRIVADSVNYLNDDIRERELEYSTVLLGVTEREPRWKECMGIVTDYLAPSVGATYVRNYFNEETKKDAIDMFNNVKKQLVKILEQVDWMDEDTRRNALAKLSAMSSVVAYSDELFDDEKLDEYYKNLELDGGNYFEAGMNYSSFNVKQQFNQLHKPVVKNDWTSQDPTAVNTFYSLMDNSIILPAGVLQGIFFSNDRPKYTNYGAMGFLVGHEITHGFDDVGNQFNINGNIEEWWAQKTKDNFEKRTKCMIEQYGNYTVDEVQLNLDGERIITEVIADNGGIKEAYYAYKDWADRNPPEQQLPNLPFNARQMFWISAAIPFCTKYTKNSLKNIVETDDHGPNEFRIVGAFSNMREFSQDFNCPIGSNMNPLEKCTVW